MSVKYQDIRNKELARKTKEFELFDGIFLEVKRLSIADNDKVLYEIENDEILSKQDKTVSLIIKSIVNWKNVKVRHLVTNFDEYSEEDLNQDVDFETQALLDFITLNLNEFQVKFLDIAQYISFLKKSVKT